LSLFITLTGHHVVIIKTGAAMTEWLSCSTHTHKVLCSNLGTTSHRMTLDKSLTAICLGSPVRQHTDCVVDIHQKALVASMWLVSVHEELK
jgi:hypothetical protein